MTELQASLSEDARTLDQAGRALFRLGRAFARLPRRDLLNPMSGGEPDLSAILLVQAVEDAEAAGEEATVGALAERLRVDSSTASRLAAQAVRTWYLRRVALQGDGRAVVLALTDAGRDLADGAARYQRAVFDEATQGWTDADRAAFAQLFVRFADDVTRMIGGAQHRNPEPGMAEEKNAEGSRVLVTVAAWHAALNAGDVERVAALADPNVEIAGLQGDFAGRELLRDWATHAGIRLEPCRWFHRGERVVVEQRAIWTDSATGGAGQPTVVATIFDVRDGLILRIARHADLTTALTAADLTESDHCE